ncbi:hypothetical protein MSIBF_A2840006 [groundwater metagenome]|uniref:Uncharacterized protein n=1 Tax=groundwater metagenome TaxID=717931 RepID=A0A098E8D0_9ZZZZ
MTGVSLPWLLGFIAEKYTQVPEDLGIKIEGSDKNVMVFCNNFMYFNRL